MFNLSQETIAIITVGLALATHIVTTTGDFRTEARADREAFRNEMQALGAKAHAAREAVRSESQADHKAFEKYITRLIQEQSRLTGIVEEMRTASR